MALRAYNHGMGLSDDDDAELPEGWQTETFHRLRAVELYASPETARLAGEAYSATWRWGYKARSGRDDEQFYNHHDAFDAADQAFVAALRRDLHVPGEDDD